MAICYNYDDGYHIVQHNCGLHRDGGEFDYYHHHHPYGYCSELREW